MREDFDFDAALAALQDGQGLTGKDGILTPLIHCLTGDCSAIAEKRATDGGCASGRNGHAFAEFGAGQSQEWNWSQNHQIHYGQF